MCGYEYPMIFIIRRNKNFGFMCFFFRLLSPINLKKGGMFHKIKGMVFEGVI